MHSLNPIPGEELWEKSEYNKPQPPKTRRRPEILRRKGERTLMRSLRTVRSLKLQQTDDIACALAAAATTVVAKSKSQDEANANAPNNAAATIGIQTVDAP
ncbi:hypothetical protein Ahy_A05g025001 [Arachis hypogaea]|uniref:Uncharacterized protein n=1 Tax=Arachis hypogaea TaxID=3818 RepID=A0A445D835_ARAHY|nr:hypothetical protein Ahy_A05g025001 [Arachis hypogaea]